MWFPVYPEMSSSNENDIVFDQDEEFFLDIQIEPFEIIHVQISTGTFIQCLPAKVGLIQAM